MSLVHTDSYSDFSESSGEVELNWYLLHESFDKCQQDLPTFEEWLDTLAEDSYEVYALKANYEETFHCQLSIYQFSALKCIRQNFTKITTGSGKNKQITYQKKQINELH